MPGQPTAEPFDAYQWCTRSVAALLAACDVLLGLAMLVGGPERFAGPSFAVARLLPGAHLTWGVLFASAGLVTSCGIVAGWRRRLVMAGLLVEACLFSFLTLSLSLAAVQSPAGALTGSVAYGVLAALCVTVWGAGHGLRSR